MMTLNDIGLTSDGVVTTPKSRSNLVKINCKMCAKFYISHISNASTCIPPYFSMINGEYSKSSDVFALFVVINDYINLWYFNVFFL